jgi:hypothetical protein
MMPEGPYVHSLARIGSVGASNAPHYVPDYLEWIAPKP